MKPELTDDFQNIVLNNSPLLDVRAPVEFEQGAFINATNIPLLNNEERKAVGICYKKRGNEAAVKLGHELINGKKKEGKILRWREFISKNPGAYLYCFRGGARSRITQMWLKENGVDITRLKGGYKAFRNYLINESVKISQNRRTYIIGGPTGAGKTLLLKKIDQAIDLEELANHRGSSFGKHITPQPTQIDFENILAYKLIQHLHTSSKPIIIENESHNIGRVYIPKIVYDNFRRGEFILLKTPLSERVEITYKEYVLDDLFQYRKIYGKEGDVKWSQNIKESILRIKKRIGNKRCMDLIKTFDKASEKQKERDDTSYHKEWIRALLTEYYDPMYKYQMSKSEKNIIFEGDEKEIIDFLSDIN